MEKVFFAKTENFSDSERMIRKVFFEHYRIRDAVISRSETGKPFLENTPLFFSVTHTKETRFIAVSDENIGIDAELISREIDYRPILSRFPFDEREEIKGKEDFLRHWTAIESTVKWLGGSLAADLKKFSIRDWSFPSAFPCIKKTDISLPFVGKRVATIPSFFHYSTFF